MLTDDGSIMKQDGSVVHFGAQRFQNEIVEGDNCFLCGENRHTVKFNDEHVIPDWILREFSLHNRLITLPNGSSLRYASYKVPCCTDCNSFLGKCVEKPISEILKGGYDTVATYMKQETPWLLFRWLALIYLKTHLKDCMLRYTLDSRKSTLPISAFYDWEAMHHIHCIVRTLLTGIKIDTAAIGSIFFFPAKEAAHIEGFDYGDLFSARSLFLSFNDTAIICVLNDACSCVTMMREGPLTNIAGPLSALQLREVFVRIAYLNTLIWTRPEFYTELGSGLPKIVVDVPDFIESRERNAEDYGKLLWKSCSDLMKNYKEDDREAIVAWIKNGQYTFLFDEDGKFVANSMDVID